MPSPSSPRKNGPNTPLEAVIRLLQDGAVLADPSTDIDAAAGHLEAAGLVTVERGECVRCADPADADFAWSNRTCPGEIVVGRAEDDARCPICDRLVYPDADAKRRRGYVRVGICPEGVMAYLRAIVADQFNDVVDVAPGVLRLSVDTVGVYLCLVDVCGDPKYLGRDWGRTQPTCYVAIDPRLERRFLPEEWICRLSLAEIVAGTADLAAALERTADSGPPALVQNASVPVCATVIPPVAENRPSAALCNRCFVVQLADGHVQIDGEVVIGTHADTRYHVFCLLCEQFLEDLRQGREPEQFRTLSLAALIERLAARLKRAVVDEMTIRRTINRLQNDLATQLRRGRGLPVAREDIIETCRWTGQGQREYGYRLNPLHVAVRPAILRKRRTGSPFREYV